MKYSYIQLTDAGKRQLMRDLSYELSDKVIAEVIDRFADGVKQTLRANHTSRLTAKKCLRVSAQCLPGGLTLTTLKP